MGFVSHGRLRSEGPGVFPARVEVPTFGGIRRSGVESDSAKDSEPPQSHTVASTARPQPRQGCAPSHAEPGTRVESMRKELLGGS